MTSLLEQAPDWLTRCEYLPKFRFLELLEKKRSIHAIRAASFARIAPQDCLSRLCIDLICKSFARFASFASGVNAPLLSVPVLHNVFLISSSFSFLGYLILAGISVSLTPLFILCALFSSFAGYLLFLRLCYTCRVCSWIYN